LGRNATNAESLAAEMAAGRELLLDLDGDVFGVPLEGFAAELSDLTTACPHG
jgi:hypothetical protein